MWKVEVNVKKKLRKSWSKCAMINMNDTVEGKDPSATCMHSHT